MSKRDNKGRPLVATGRASAATFTPIKAKDNGMANSTSKPRKPAIDKPKKPYPGFPLTPHATGKWCKSIRGKLHYFGSWARRKNGKLEPIPGDGWQDAIEEYKKQADDLHAGRKPRDNGDCLTIADLCNAFLTHCDRRVADGEMVSRTREVYHRTTDRIVRVFGKTRMVEDLHPDDFATLRADISKTRGPVATANGITCVRVVFNFAYKNLLANQPVRYGLSFDQPTKKLIRKAKARNGKRLFDAVDCRRMIESASTPELKAMVLLALNCGFGNSDCAKLPISAVNFETAWIDFPRPKTGVERRCTLWPESVAALKAVRERRDQERERLFVTKYGNSLDRDSACVTKQFRKLLDELGIYRPGLSFYTLRHVFRTVADGCRDQVAVNHIMGHIDDSMAAVYREQIDDDRLQAAADYVRAWLFEDDEPSEPTAGRLRIVG